MRVCVISLVIYHISFCIHDEKYIFQRFLKLLKGYLEWENRLNGLFPTPYCFFGENSIMLGTILVSKCLASLSSLLYCSESLDNPCLFDLKCSPMFLVVEWQPSIGHIFL